MATAKSMRLAAQASGRESIDVVAVSAGGKIIKNGLKTGEKVTDGLYDICSALRRNVSAAKAFSDLTVRLSKTIDELKIDFNLIDELKKIGDEAQKNSSPDFLISRGEYLYARMFASLVGMPFVDSAEIIKFDKFGNPDFEFSEFLIKEKYKETGGFVTGGFYGGDVNGDIRLFPRGGGDITGAVLARALSADVYENFTDVDGIMPVPPKIAKECGAASFAFKPLSRLSFRQTERLADFSVEVLHPAALEVLKGTGIPILIKNTFNELSAGTIISDTDIDEKNFFFAVDRWERIEENIKRKSDEVKLYSDFLSRTSERDLCGKYLFYISFGDESDGKIKRLKNRFDGDFSVTDEGSIFAIIAGDFISVLKILSM